MQKPTSTQNLPFITKIMQYFTNPKYYLSTTFQPLKNNVLMLFLVLLLLGVPWGVYQSSTNIPKSIEYIRAVSSDFISNYPQDLSFSWNENQLQYQFADTEIATEPLTIPFSSELPEIPAGFPQNFAYITNDLTTPEERNITPNQYLFFVNPEQLFTAGDISNQSWESSPLTEFFSEVQSITIEKSDVEFVLNATLAMLNENQSIIQIMYVILLVPLFILGKIWTLLVETIFVLLFFKLYNMKLTAQQTLNLAISVFIPTTIITTTAELLYGPLPFALNTFGFWIVLIYILYSQRNSAILQVRNENKKD